MDVQGFSSAPGRTGWRFYINVTWKALTLFLIANLVFGLWNPMEVLGRLSAYNRLFPGRPRLPYGDNPEKAYNLSLYNLEAMFAAHEISGNAKPANEYRVILIGDSSTWGYLLPAGETVTAALNDAGLVLPDGRRVRAYNLGYPIMSLAKDLLILSYAVRYQPDLIIWPVTLESFPYDKQLFPPLLRNNPGPMRALIERFGLKLNPDESAFVQPTFWSQTIVGARRPLADLVRLQLYGVLWAATGIDQDIPESYTLRQEDLAADESFHDLKPPRLQSGDLAFEMLAAGVEMAQAVPVLFINEPMFISQGENSHIRYNFYYPRWTYDGYRELIAQESATRDWNYLDLWDAIPQDEFTNSAVHMTATGTRMYAGILAQAIFESAAR